MSHPCGHSGCTCTVEGDAAFCSEACAQVAASGAHTSGHCPCGHPDCD